MRARPGSPWSAGRALCAGILLLCGFATTVSAGPVAVRSGEHPGFSRLVIDFGQVPQWTVNDLEGGRRFEFGGEPVALDVTDVFARMGRSRIESVSAGPGYLDLTLTCDCGVTAFELVGGRLVIDVSERARTGARPVARKPEAAFVRPRVLGETLGSAPLAGIDSTGRHAALVAADAPAETSPFSPRAVVAVRPVPRPAPMPRATVPGDIPLIGAPPAPAAAGSRGTGEAAAGSLPPYRGAGLPGARHGASPLLLETLSAQDRHNAATEAMSRSE